MGGSASIANAVISSKNAKKSFDEASRHNQMMEAIAIGGDKHGNGLYLRPYKKGLGLFYSKKKKTQKKQKCKNKLKKRTIKNKKKLR